MSEISLNLFYKTQDRVGTELSLRHAWAASMFVSVHLHTCSCISLDLPEGETSLPGHLHPSPQLTGSVLLATCFPELSEASNTMGLPCSAPLPLIGVRTVVVRGSLWNYWEALGNHAGQAWEMIVYLAQYQQLLTVASSPGGGTVSGFSLRC